LVAFLHVTVKKEERSREIPKGQQQNMKFRMDRKNHDKQKSQHWKQTRDPPEPVINYQTRDSPEPVINYQTKDSPEPVINDQTRDLGSGESLVW
jgi:hypothetical protein